MNEFLVGRPYKGRFIEKSAVLAVPRVTDPALGTTKEIRQKLATRSETALRIDFSKFSVELLTFQFAVNDLLR